jgi:hypothetical protein
MKNFKYLAFALLGIAISGFGSTAMASVSFQNLSAITFDVDNVYAGLVANGSFMQEVDLSGNDDGGVVNANNVDVYDLSLGTQHQFNVSSNELFAGSIEASYIGKYAFSFENTSSNDYSIQLSVAYDLSTSTTGQDSSLILDFSDDYEYLDQIYLSAAIPGSPSDSANSAINYTFNLAAGETTMYYVDITSGANLYAAPVPLPTAAWLFLWGVFGMFGVNKRRMKATLSV